MDSSYKTFSIGIAGHRNIANAKTAAFVFENCFDVLKRLKREHKDVVALSALAEGADTLFGEAAVALNIPLRIVRPFRQYASDFTSPSAKRRYHRLRSRAYRESKLAYTGRSDAAYLEGMYWIVDNSDLVVAVWDGSSSRGSGGTGDAVDRAILMNRDWIHLDVSELSVIYHLSTDARVGE
jgi:hypothetical protein